MKNIYLVGFMGAGKSTIGVELAALCVSDFNDLDELIVQEQGRSINDIFAAEGEDYFRNVESKILVQIANNKSLVVATGGGIIERERNRDMISQSGISVFLDTDWDTIVSRLEQSNNRPLVAKENGWDTVKKRFDRRLPLYRESDYTVLTKNKSPKEIATEIYHLVKDRI
ncbi:MAG: shikimate kinase [Desulfuromonas sp.]|nr:MAG: shikimate kinase [Desulfuromonas sp.]